MTTNASASAFGWEFQTNAALVLMLKSIDSADAVRVEGATDDIEIYYDDSTVDYCQAKARTTNKPGENSESRFTSALHTLAADAAKENCRRAIYVTNDSIPLGESHNDITFSRDSVMSFSDLSPDQQQYILKRFESVSSHDRKRPIDVDIDAIKEHLWIYVMWFYGTDNATRTETVHSTIEEFIGNIDSKLGNRFTSRLYNSWLAKLHSNEVTTNTDIKVSKAELVWPLIVILLEAHEDDGLFENLDEETARDVLETYRQIIDEATERFDLVTKIQTDYEAYRRTHHDPPKKCREGFTNEHIQAYRELIGAEVIEGTTGDYVTAMVIKKVVTQKDTISKVREVVNLAD